MSVKSHEAFSLDSFQNQLFFFDDFLGSQLKDEWHEVGTGSAAVVDLQMGGIVRLTSGATTNDVYNISWSFTRSLHVDKRVSVEVRMKANQATYITINLQLRFDGDDRIYFQANEAVGGATTWVISCVDGGATTGRDSGVALDTDYHIFRMEAHLHGGSHVHFYIDDVETDNSPIDTNVPDDGGDYLQPYIIISTREDVAKSMDVDYVGVRQDV